MNLSGIQTDGISKEDVLKKIYQQLNQYFGYTLIGNGNSLEGQLKIYKIQQGNYIKKIIDDFEIHFKNMKWDIYSDRQNEIVARANDTNKIKLTTNLFNTNTIMNIFFDLSTKKQAYQIYIIDDFNEIKNWKKENQWSNSREEIKYSILNGKPLNVQPYIDELEEITQKIDNNRKMNNNYNVRLAIYEDPKLCANILIESSDIGELIDNLSSKL